MKKAFILLLCSWISPYSFSQVITGMVLDRKTNDTIDFATVYFNGTQVGTYSDAHGRFRLDISGHASMPLTVSAIGYYSVTVTDYSPVKPLRIMLDPKVYELQEVVVSAKSHARERKEFLRVFRNEFLGTSGNASACTIENEGDILFDYKSGWDTLRAFASKPLLIDNHALGYQITYFLDKFEYYRRTKSFIFKGNIIFKEDVNVTPKERQAFERKRKIVYLGSRMQFFRALWAGDLSSAGFTMRNSSNLSIDPASVVTLQSGTKKYLWYYESLGICYYSGEPTSRLEFLKGQVYFDDKGYYDASAVKWMGRMAEQRIADWLPYDYQ